MKVDGVGNFRQVKRDEKERGRQLRRETSLTTKATQVPFSRNHADKQERRDLNDNKNDKDDKNFSTKQDERRETEPWANFFLPSPVCYVTMNFVKSAKKEESKFVFSSSEVGKLTTRRRNKLESFKHY